MCNVSDYGKATLANYTCNQEHQSRSANLLKRVHCRTLTNALEIRSDLLLARPAAGPSACAYHVTTGGENFCSIKVQWSFSF